MAVLAEASLLHVQWRPALLGERKRRSALVFFLPRRNFKFWFVEVGCPEDVSQSPLLFPFHVYLL